MLIFKYGTDRIQPKTIHPQIQPKPDCVEHGFLDLWIIPIKIWLFFKEKMVVIFVSFLIYFPGTAAKGGIPVGGRTTIFPLFPDIPIPLGVIQARPRLDKPGMFIRRMVQHQVQDEIHSTLMKSIQKTFELLQIAILGCYVLVI